MYCLKSSKRILASSAKSSNAQIEAVQNFYEFDLASLGAMNNGCLQNFRASPVSAYFYRTGKNYHKRPHFPDP